MNREQAMKLADEVRRAQLKIVREGLQGGRWIEDIDDAVSKIDLAAIVDEHVAEAEQQNPIAHIANKYGDPESFAERELRFDENVIQRLPIGTKLYTSPPAVPVSDDFPLAFITTESGGGDYKLVMSFGSMADMHRAHNQVIAELAAVHKAAVAVPEGWQLVPLRPTDNMLDSGIDAGTDSGAWAIYRAMLAAAPKPEGGA